MNIALRRFLHNHGNIATEGSPKPGLYPTLFFEWLQRFFIVHSTTGSTVHSRYLQVTNTSRYEWATGADHNEIKGRGIKFRSRWTRKSCGKFEDVDLSPSRAYNYPENISTQCCCNVDKPSATLAEHKSDIESTSSVLFGWVSYFAVFLFQIAKVLHYRDQTACKPYRIRLNYHEVKSKPFKGLLGAVGLIWYCILYCREK